MIEFVREAIRPRLVAASKKLTAAAVYEILATENAIADFATCDIHGKRCRWPVSSDIHTAGTPCIDWSKMPGGSHAGLEGKTALAMTTWICQRRRARERVVCHEKVPGFLFSILTNALGDLYIVQSLVVDLKHCGIPGRRKRRFTLMVLRDVARTATPWSELFVSKCIRTLNVNFALFLLASEDEVDAEVAWLQTRRDFVRDSQHRDDMDVQAHRCMSALTVKELRWLRLYRSQWPHCIYTMSQDPLAMPNHSTDQLIQTQTIRMGMMFYDNLSR